MAVPSGETQLLGTKKVTDLVENLSIEGDKVKGSLKYLESYPEFDKSAKGNFLPLYFEEAKGASKGTVKCELKGTGAKLKKPVAVDEKDGLIIFNVHNTDNIIEVTQEGKETRTLDLSELELKQQSN